MTDIKTPKALQPGDKYVVRFPDGMRDRIADSARANNRSMNAEIVDRLEGSFETPEAMKDISATLSKLIAHTEDKNNVISAQQRLLSMCAVVLRLTAERVAESDNPVSNRLMVLTKEFANYMVHGNFEGAQKPIVEMVELGMKMGVLDEDGKVKPEHKHLTTDFEQPIAVPAKKPKRKLSLD